MLRLLQFLFTGHIHKWKILEICTRLYTDIYNPKLNHKEGYNYYLQCEICGDVKKRSL